MCLHQVWLVVAGSADGIGWEDQQYSILFQIRHYFICMIIDIGIVGIASGIICVVCYCYFIDVNELNVGSRQ